MRLYFVSSEVTKSVSHLDLSRQILGDPVFAFDCTVHQDVVNVKISSCFNYDYARWETSEQRTFGYTYRCNVNQTLYYNKVRTYLSHYSVILRSGRLMSIDKMWWALLKVFVVMGIRNARWFHRDYGYILVYLGQHDTITLRAVTVIFTNVCCRRNEFWQGKEQWGADWADWETIWVHIAELSRHCHKYHFQVHVTSILTWLIRAQATTVRMQNLRCHQYRTGDIFWEAGSTLW